MKLLLTVHQFLPEYSSGTEILTFKTAKELQSRGHEVRVLTGWPVKAKTSNSNCFDTYNYEGLDVVRFYHFSSLSGTENIFEVQYSNLFFANWFESYLHDWRPDIVHFFHLQWLSALAIDVCTKLKIQTVMTTTDFWLVCPTNQLRLPNGSFCRGPNAGSVNCVRHIIESSGLHKIDRTVKHLPDWVMRILIKGVQKRIFPEKWYSAYVRAITNRILFMQKRMDKINRILVPARLMNTILAEYAPHPNRILYLPYGLDTGNIKLSVRENSNSMLQLGFIGTLYEHKGPHILLEAVCRLLPDLPVQLKIYGNLDDFPEYVSRLYDIANGDPRVTFCGTFPNTEIGNVLSGLDVLVVPSIWYENTPLVVYSAQASGCPVIASNVGGIAEIIQHEVNGLLFEMGNAEKLANAILRLDRDKALLKRLSEQAMPPPSIQQYADELESVYAAFG